MLGVTIKDRVAALSSVPAIAEIVPGYEASGWLGVCAPAKTQPDVIAKLNQSIGLALNDPTVKARLASLGDTVQTMSPAEIRAYVAALVDKWAKVIHAANIKVE